MPRKLLLLRVGAGNPLRMPAVLHRYHTSPQSLQLFRQAIPPSAITPTPDRSPPRWTMPMAQLPGARSSRGRKRIATTCKRSSISVRAARMRVPTPLLRDRPSRAVQQRSARLPILVSLLHRPLDLRRQAPLQSLKVMLAQIQQKFTEFRVVLRLLDYQEVSLGLL